MIDRRLHLLALCLAIAGCAAPAPSLKPVSASAETVIREKLAVTPTAAWNRFEGDETGKIATWTKEGMPLDQLQFYVAIADGETLAPQPKDAKVKLPPFRADMSPSELVDLLQVHWTQGGAHFKVERLEPGTFVGQSGFKLEYAFVRLNDQVTLRGIAWGAVVGRELYVIDWMAPRLGFFDRYRGEVEALAATARVLH